MLSSQATSQRQKPVRNSGGAVIILNQFSMSTWLLIGAAIQSLLVLLPIRPLYSLGPAFFFLLFRLIETALMTWGVLENKYMKGVIPGRVTAMFPASTDSADGPKDNSICVFLLTTRANHPLGILAPGFKELGGYNQSMMKVLEADAATNGFLGSSSWINASDRSTKSELLTTMYFRSAADVHAFAHSKVHRDGWNWWNRMVKTGEKGGLKHISISHEIYEVPKGNWETIYGNSHPSSFGATSIPVVDEKSGETMWMSPIFDASKGRLRTHKGRRGVGSGDDNDVYEHSDTKPSSV